MSKRTYVFLPFLLTFLLAAVLGAVPCAFAAGGFFDLQVSDPAYPFVKYLAGKGVVGGYPDGSFRPDGTITRAEVAACLSRVAGTEAAMPGQLSYKDLPYAHWAYNYAETVSANGLFKGYPDGTFRPGAPVTRAETAAILLRLTKEKQPKIDFPPEVTDVDPGHWAGQSIAIALNAGLLTVTQKGCFEPEIPATRAQFARGLAEMLIISPERAEASLVGTLVPLKGKVYLTISGGQTREIKAETACGIGSTIKTGEDSSAELRFADGSGFMIKPATELTIKKARGQSTIFRDGSAGALVDGLELDLPKGQIFGALAAGYFYKQEEQDAENNPASINLTAPEQMSSLLASQSLPEDIFAVVTGKTAPAAPNSQPAWWKKPYQKRARVTVNMPWGVASYRSCFFMNWVKPALQETSMYDGIGELTSGGNGVLINSGQTSYIKSPGGAPTVPAGMTAEEFKEWLNVKQWFEERCSAIQNNFPVVIPTDPSWWQGIPENILPKTPVLPEPPASGSVQPPAPSGGGGGTVLPEISFELLNGGGEPGSLVELLLKVSNAADLYGVELEFTFNPEFIEVVDIAPETQWNNDNGFTGAKYDNENGVVSYIATRKGADKGLDGEVRLSVVTFKTLAAGRTALVFKPGHKLCNSTPGLIKHNVNVKDYIF